MALGEAIEKVGDAYALRLEIRALDDGTLLAGVGGPPVRHGAILETVGRLALDLRGQLDTSVRLPDPPVHVSPETSLFGPCSS